LNHFFLFETLPHKKIPPSPQRHINFTMSRQASPVPVRTIIANIKEEHERQHMFSHLETVQQCIEYLPVAYRPALKTKYFALADIAEKRGRVNKMYLTLRHHANTGTFPPQLEAVHEPAFQFTKEYLESENSSDDAYASLMHTAWINFRSNSLKHVTDRKRAELTFLEKKLRPAAYHDEILTAVKAVRNSQRQIAGIEGVSTIVEDVSMGDGSGTATPTQSAPSLPCPAVGRVQVQTGWTPTIRW
jgi:hypothetical protein